MNTELVEVVMTRDSRRSLSSEWIIDSVLVLRRRFWKASSACSSCQAGEAGTHGGQRDDRGTGYRQERAER